MGNCKSNQTHIETSFEERQKLTESKSFNPFYETNSFENADKTILSQYRFHSHYNDKYLGKCDVLEEINSKDLYLSKEQTFSNEEEYEKQVSQLRKRKQTLTSENVIQIKEIICKNSDGMLWDLKKIICLLDYPFISLQREIASRRQKKLPFSKQECTNMTISMIKGYSNIQKSGFTNQKVRLKNIFLGIKNKNPIVKVAETNLIAMQSNYNSIVEDGSTEDNSDIYLSPEEMISCSKAEASRTSTSKEGVFSLGMSLLELYTLNRSSQMYDYVDFKIDESETSNRIGASGKRYGGFIERILKDMLKFDKNQRPTFSQLQEKIPKLIKRQDEHSNMHISVVPSRSSQFMNNSQSKPLRSSVSPSRIFSSRMNSEKSKDTTTVLLQSNEQYTNGNQYKGQKKNGLKHGIGRYTFKDGSYYEGGWKNDRMEGKGDLYFSNGKLQYTGQWKKDQYDGWGILTREGDSWIKYEGEFKNGLKQGRGKMVFRDSSIYDGEFKGDRICGNGRKISADGKIEDKYWESTNPTMF